MDKNVTDVRTKRRLYSSPKIFGEHNKRYVYFQRTCAHTYTNGKKIIILSFMTAEARYITAQKVYKVGSFNKLIASVEMFSLLSMKISN